MSQDEPHEDIDNLFVAPYVEFEVTNAERDLIETALLHLRNNFESIREDEQGDLVSVIAYRENMIEDLLSKFESVHRLRNKNES
jgi:hypothetical protein